jgi:hypothetical protein
MQTSAPREPDQVVAPLAFLYLAGVVAALAALLSWVFWFRGYA